MLYVNHQGLGLPTGFDGACRSTLEGKSGGGSVVDINADEMLDVSLFPLPISTYLPKNALSPRGFVR